MPSYAELLTATVELNLSDFEAKLHDADGVLTAFGKKAGFKGSTDSFSSVGSNMIKAAIAGMNDFADQVMMEADIEVPKQTEVLRDSARILPAVKAGNRIRVQMGYGYGDAINPDTGRQAAQYALPVHEIYDATHMEPQKDHFLSDPLFLLSGRYGPTLQLYMRQTVAGTSVPTVFRASGGDITMIPLKTTPAGTVHGPGGRFV